MEEVEFEKKKVAGEKESLKKQDQRLQDEMSKYKTRQLELAEELSRVSGLTRDEAKNILLKEMEEDAKVDFAKSFRKRRRS